MEVRPDAIDLNHRFDYVQLLVTARLESGDTLDVTRLVQVQVSAPVVEISPTGFVRAKTDGRAVLQISLAGQTANVPVQVSGAAAEFHADFIRDVNPVLSRLGCNQGTCHGAAKGKNGFKLSLRGYDALFDIRSFTDDLASRRTNVASPDDSLMLLKATAPCRTSAAS